MLRCRRQALSKGTGELTGAGAGIGTGTGTGIRAGTGAGAGTSTTLSGEVVKIECDGSYDSYFCCATGSADSQEEGSLALQFRKISWYDSESVSDSIYYVNFIHLDSSFEWFGMGMGRDAHTS